MRKLSRRNFIGASVTGAGVLSAIGPSLSKLTASERTPAKTKGDLFDARSNITIEIELRVEDGRVMDKLTYSRGSARERKEKLLSKIRQEKANRGRTFVLPSGDHSEHLEHDSWIVQPGDKVSWKSTRMFMLAVEPDLGVCNSIADAPKNPFDWTGVQAAKKVNGIYMVEGVARNDRSQEQMFYKYTAWVAGAEPLDPDGICGSDG